jgi:hypothetical protein
VRRPPKKTPTAGTPASARAQRRRLGGVWRASRPTSTIAAAVVPSATNANAPVAQGSPVHAMTTRPDPANASMPGMPLRRTDTSVAALPRASAAERRYRCAAEETFGSSTKPQQKPCRCARVRRSHGHRSGHPGSTHHFGVSFGRREQAVANRMGSDVELHGRGRLPCPRDSHGSCRRGIRLVGRSSRTRLLTEVPSEVTLHKLAPAVTDELLPVSCRLSPTMPAIPGERHA